LYDGVVKAREMKDKGITVKVQKIFPNCEKYSKCCKSSNIKPPALPFGTPLPKPRKVHIAKKNLVKPDGFDGW